MILLMIHKRESDRRMYIEQEDLTEALVKAKDFHEEHGYYATGVYEGPIICKARWGPEDPGGMFNHGGHTVDKGVSNNVEPETDSYA